MAFVSIEFKSFFDEPKIIAAMSRKERVVLARTGGFARTYVRRSMRPGGKKGKSSEHGKPPRYHRNPFLRNLTLFAYDELSGSVVLGPLLKVERKSRFQPVGKTVPEILEEGGQAVVRSRPNSKKKKHTRARYKARPFIAPATPVAADVLRKNMRDIPLK